MEIETEGWKITGQIAGMRHPQSFIKHPTRGELHERNLGFRYQSPSGSITMIYHNGNKISTPKEHSAIIGRE